MSIGIIEPPQDQAAAGIQNSAKARNAFRSGATDIAAGHWRAAFEAEPRAWWTAMEVLRVLRSAAVPSAPGSRLLIFSPNYAANSYQRNLYCTDRGHGFATRAVTGLNLDAQLASDSLTDRLIVHQHWLKELYWTASDFADGIRLVERHLGLLKALQAFGACVYWTLHNLIDHDASDLQRAVCEYALRRMAEVADRILVHTSGSAEALNAHCGRDWACKYWQLEHSLYTNLLHVPPTLPRELTAASLAGRRVVVCIGMMRPYKGVADLLSGFTELVDQGRASNMHLVIAGRMMDPEAMARIGGLSASVRERISCVARELTEPELAGLMRRADICVTPYRKILVSGSYYLNTTFAKPTLAPRRGMFDEVIVDGESGLLYDGSRADLVRALAKVADMPAAQLASLGEKALAANHGQGALEVSNRFFKALEDGA